MGHDQLKNFVVLYGEEEKRINDHCRTCMHIHEKLEIREWLLRSREIDEKKKRILFRCFKA